jgi:hypothetical protein
MLAPKLLLTHKTMKAAIIVTNIRHIPRQLILFDPVQFKIAKRLVVETPDDGETVAAPEAVAEEFFLVRLRAGFAPEVGHARVVHPFVEVFGVGEAEV